MFLPDEVIFSCGTECNLHCAHCFVSRGGARLSASDAARFLESCAAESASAQVPIEKVGFSGGEPFLHLDFVAETARKCVELGLMFDRVMTNGVWWKSEAELEEKLRFLYESGYDGKFGLSFDSFHGQDCARMERFIRCACAIWNDGSAVEIQSATNPDSKAEKKFQGELESLARNLGCNIEEFCLRGSGFFVPVMRVPQSFPPERASWNDEAWFEDDFCEGPGNVLYVHADGSVAPCCGFANECRPLIIGAMEDGYSGLMRSAAQNPMLRACYETGLAQVRRNLEAQGRKFPGVTKDMCMFCAWLCGEGQGARP